MALSIGTGIVQDGLICHLDAANIRSYPGFGNTWYDISGNNFNYTLVSGPSFDSKNGGSIYFDGSNYAFCNMSWPSNFTFEIILRAQKNNNDNYARIIGTGPNYEFEFAFDEVTRQIRYYSGWTSTTEYIDYNKNINYTFTKNSSNISLYRNGTLVYQGSVGASPGSTIYLASMFNGGQRTKLNIYSFKIYNRTLSASEILQNYNSTKQRYIYNQPIINNGLMVGLDFSDPLTYTGIGNTVFDLSVNTYRGTLTNGPKFTNDKNGGIIFDGVDDRIDFSSNLSNIITNNFSFEFVAKPNATITTSAESTSGIAGATGKRYLIEPTNESADAGFGIALGTNAIECIEHGGSYLPVLLSYSANLSDINHYCVVVNDKKSRLYINGVFIKEGLQSPRSSRIRNTASLGYMYYGNYSGTIYEFNSYSRALSANEIRSIFEQNRGKYGIKSDRDKSGLILDLDFGNRSCYPGTGTSAQDLSGFGYTATLNSSPIFSRDQRGNFQFTGSQTITIPTSGPLVLTKNDNYTLNFWVYTNSTQAQGSPSILEYTDTNSYAFAVRFGMSNSTIQCKAYDGVNPINPTCDVSYVFDKWNHICAVYNWSKKSIEVYVNGKLGNRTNLDSYTFGSINNTSAIGIANRQNFSGRIAELKIYKRALNSTEINDYYLSTKDRFFTDREDIRDGLILELDANNYDSYPGGNTWFDTSGLGITAYMNTNIVYSRDRINNSFLLSGNFNNYFVLGTVPVLDGYQLPVTYFGWFKLTSIVNFQCLFGIYNTTSIIYNMLRIDQNAFRFFLSLNQAPEYQYFEHSTAVTTGIWYNFAIVVGGTLSSPSLTVYINNKSQTFSPLAMKNTVTLNQIQYIGQNNSNQPFNGNISQYRIYNRTLSASEVNTLFQNTRSRYGI